MIRFVQKVETMKQFDPKAFDERVAKCPKKTQTLVAFLRTVAEHAGEHVGRPTFEVRGVGITYWTNKRRFCRFDPKHEADHVGALIPGGDREALKEAGTVSSIRWRLESR